MVIHKPINNFNNIIHDNSILENTQTILSSIFTYYNGFYNILNKKTNSSFKSSLNKNFINLINSKKIYIIDYANIIHILHNKYKDTNKIITLFYTFIYKHLLLNETIFIISKNVSIHNTEFNFNIESVFNIGEKLTSLTIPKKYFENEKINVYNLEIKSNNKISSSSDDLLGHFICFNIFVYLFKNNKKPENKIIMMTNDTQKFDKNLFGTTYDEDKYQIDFYKDVIIQKLIIKNHQYKLVREKLDEDLITNFYKEYIITNQDDTKDMECIIISFIELLINTNRNNKLYTGKYYTHEKVNKNFTRKKFIKKSINFSYNQLNKLFIKAVTERNNKIFYKDINCLFDNIEKITYSNGDLKKTYYLYAYIKYIQSFLHKNNINNHKSKIIYDLYGSINQNNIIGLFNFT
jgi:hypothetical protein